METQITVISLLPSTSMAHAPGFENTTRAGDTLGPPRTRLVAARRRNPTSISRETRCFYTPGALSLPAAGAPMDALLRVRGSSGGDHLRATTASETAAPPVVSR
jgi:hypothetical protein